MELKFEVTIKNEQHVYNLERNEDVVFFARLTTLIVTELQKYNSDVNRDSIHVSEVVSYLKGYK